MKATLRAVLALTLLATFSQAANTNNATKGLYLGAGIGVMATDRDGDDGIGLSLRAGLPLNSALKGLGLQFELNKSLEDPEYNRNINNNIDVLTFATYATFDIAIPRSKVTLRPKIGLILPNLEDDIDSRDIILSSGFGMTYAVENNVRLYLDYTVLAQVISNYSAGLEIRF